MSEPDQHSSLFFVLGATHHQAAIEVREKLALSTEAVEQLNTDFAGLMGLKEYVVLNTCNRTEFYGVATSPETVKGMQKAFCRQQDFPEPEFENIQLHLQGMPAIQHLLEVASGLDSQLIGENEVFGQVKGAYARAQNMRSTGPVLNRVFQKAFQAAKHVRTQTAISSGMVSVANVAVDLAQTIFGALDNTRILLLGAGDIGEKTAKAFQSRGAGSITVSSRHIEHAMELAQALDATALPFENRSSHLANFDIVVCSTAAPDCVVSVPSVQAAMKKRTARPLFLIDLALPRDVEANVATLQNVYVYNLDDLAKIADENRSAREAEIEKCRKILNARADSLWGHITAQLERMVQSEPKPPAPGPPDQS